MTDELYIKRRFTLLAPMIDERVTATVGGSGGRVSWFRGNIFGISRDRCFAQSDCGRDKGTQESSEASVWGEFEGGGRP